MSASFPHSTQSLAVDRSRRSIWGLLTVAALLLAWAAWLFLGRVVRYEVTGRARLEVGQAAHPIATPVSGRVMATYGVLGQEVAAGDLLVELDTRGERLRLEEARANLTALSTRVGVLRNELLAEQEALRAEREAARLALHEARARHREAALLVPFAEEEAERLARLHAEAGIGELDVLRAEAEAQRRRGAAETLRLAVGSLEGDQRTKASERRARLERNRSEVARLEGEIATGVATIRRLEHEVERRSIRAPVSGRLGELANLRVGSVVEEGARLGAVVPAGELKVVADFLPVALGKVRPGQRARLRLQGFPWTQYGSIPATVTTVATELRSGLVRAELAVRSNSPTPIPVQHGLPGTVEVEVERVSPAVLLLRTAGHLLQPGPEASLPSRAEADR